MFGSFWLMLLIFSYNSLQVKSDLSSFSQVMGNGKISTSKSLLNSIIESFEERSQIHCVLVIHDDIGINVRVQSTFLSKSKEGNVGIEPTFFFRLCKFVTYDKRLKMKRDTQQKAIFFHFRLFVVHYGFSTYNI